jgi:arylsulfatase A-like enzyme
VLSALDELTLRDSTLVVLTADHGESLGEHDYIGHGRRLFESIIRIPLIVRLPGEVPAGLVVPAPVSILDTGPTILDPTVEKLPRYKRPPVLHAGHSFVAAFRNGGWLPGRTQYYVTFAGKKGFAPGWLSWLWVREEELPLRLGRLRGAGKTVWSPGGDSLEIYDVASDPRELGPVRLDPGGSEYEKETASLRRWFSATKYQEGEDSLTSRDLEVLRSLGYVQ